MIFLAEGSLVVPQPGLAIWTLVTFVLVAILLRWKVWGPLMKTIDEREKTISDAVDTAKREREEAQKLLAQQQAAIADAKKEAAEMVRKNRLEVDNAKAELIAKAKSEADQLLATARREIEDEKRKAIAEVRTVAADLAVMAAGKLVKQNMDDKAQHALAEEFIASAQKQGRASAA